MKPNRSPRITRERNIFLTLLLIISLPALLYGQDSRTAPYFLWELYDKVIATVYISAPIKDGFVDTSKSIQDSVKDLQKKLRKMKKIFRIVDRAEHADLVVTIVMRDVGSETYGQRITASRYGGYSYENAQLTKTEMVKQTLWVSAVMEIASYRKEFVGTAVNIPGVRWGRWTECANNLAKDLKTWTLANREQIKQHRQPATR